ncbi:MAG: hypothetical protein JWO52_4105 [Gammaproteobacteria bacterium]|nr:hypothetical protein [Gammaproteobacteria bacterium]
MTWWMWLLVWVVGIVAILCMFRGVGEGDDDE